MKKKTLTIIFSLILVFSLVGCAEADTKTNINIEINGKLINKVVNNLLIPISDDLWYDSTTKIVYWWNGSLNMANCATTPTPYYASNGLPYRYNSETNTLEEINNQE